MERTSFFSQLEVQRLLPKLAWASVEVMADDVDMIQVLASGNEEDVQALRIRCEEGTLKIDQPTYGLTYKLNMVRWMQVMIRVPRDWRGKVEASTVNGSLRVRGLKGTDLFLDTVSGTMEGEELEAIKLKASSVSGSIRLHRLQTKELNLKSVSGDMLVTGALAEEVHINNVSGSAELVMEDNFLSMDANMVSGQVRVTAPMDYADAAMHSVSGRLLTSEVSIRKEGPVISMMSVSGDLELIRAE